MLGGGSGELLLFTGGGILEKEWEGNAEKLQLNFGPCFSDSSRIIGGNPNFISFFSDTIRGCQR